MTSKKTAMQGAVGTARRKGHVTSKSPTGYKTTWAAAGNPEGGSRQRVQAFTKLGGAVCDDMDVFRGTLAVVRDTKAPLSVRQAALSSLQAASFSSPNFSACRPTYMAGLRALVADPELEIRQRVLGFLAREGDGYAQDVLLKGLSDPGKAAVPPEKALQLLAYDPKAESYAVARRIVQRPPNPEAKQEALRLLGADSRSAKLFESLLMDKQESVEVRQIAASALNALDPDSLQKLARRIVLDVAETPELQAMSLSAMTNFGNEEAMVKDKPLAKRAARLAGSKSPQSVKASAKSFRRKYKR